jgi:hypothetical protein
MSIPNDGQVRLAHPFGQWISKYAADNRFTRYLEIGTWNGRGSTYCVHDGFAKRTDTPVLQSYEIQEPRFQEASATWKHVPTLQILHGRILKDNECPLFEHVLDVHPNIELSWHKEDITHFWTCPYIAPNNPEVVILDGAEFLTYFEFEKLRHMPSIQVYILDDAFTPKNLHSYTVLSQSPDWKLVVRGEDRNGWAIFERLPNLTNEDL